MLTREKKNNIVAINLIIEWVHFFIMPCIHMCLNIDLGLKIYKFIIFFKRIYKFFCAEKADFNHVNNYKSSKTAAKGTATSTTG